MAQVKRDMTDEDKQALEEYIKKQNKRATFFKPLLIAYIVIMILLLLVEVTK